MAHEVLLSFCTAMTNLIQLALGDTKKPRLLQAGLMGLSDPQMGHSGIKAEGSAR